MLGETKYSRRLADIASIVIIDEFVVKNREGNITDVTEKYISDAKENFNDIIIQTGNHMEIYSSNDNLEIYMEALDMSSLEKVKDNRHPRYCNVALYDKKDGKISYKMYI